MYKMFGTAKTKIQTQLAKTQLSELHSSMIPYTQEGGKLSTFTVIT